MLLKGRRATREVAAAAAAGRGGDRYRVYEHDRTKMLALAFTIVFDSKNDALEFARAYGSGPGRNCGTAEASFVTLAGKRSVAIVKAPDGRTARALDRGARGGAVGGRRLRPTRRARPARGPPCAASTTSRSG